MIAKTWQKKLFKMKAVEFKYNQAIFESSKLRIYTYLKVCDWTSSDIKYHEISIKKKPNNVDANCCIFIRLMSFLSWFIPLLNLEE